MKFYVYTLVDPRDGATFYIGKGSGRRINQHELDARRGKRSEKCDRIRAIEAAGLAVVKTKVQTFAAERDAYAYEAMLIRTTAGLTNAAPGGGGGYSGPRDAPCDGASADLKVLMVAIAAKFNLWRVRGEFAQAIQRALLPHADEFIAKFWPTVDKDALRREFRMRGVNLIIEGAGQAI